MKIKGDFITNSSSTNYVVDENFLGELKIPIQSSFGDLIKNFFDYTKRLFKVGEDDKIGLAMDASLESDSIKMSAKLNEEHLEVVIDDVYLYNLDIAIELYGAKLENMRLFYSYSANQQAREVDKAIKTISRQISQELFEAEEIEVQHNRKIMDYQGDGWDGGDPCFGHYGDSDIACAEVDVNETVIL